MRNLTKLIYISTVFLLYRLIYEYFDSTEDLNIIECNEIRPVKMIVKSKGYYPRHLSQCGWDYKSFVIILSTILLPHLHNLFDPKFMFIRYFRRLFVFVASMSSLVYDLIKVVEMSYNHIEQLDSLFELNRTAFVTTIYFQIVLNCLWIASVFTSMSRD